MGPGEQQGSLASCGAAQAEPARPARTLLFVFLLAQAILLLTQGLGFSAELAQGPRALPPSAEPGREPPPMAPPPPEADFIFTIPTPQRAPAGQTGEQLRLQVKDIIVEGATLYSRAELQPLFQPLIGTMATLNDLAKVATAIQDKYAKAGYGLTRAFVPPQRVQDGRFTIRVVEGYISAVSVQSKRSDLAERVKSFLQPVTTERPVRIETIEEGLLRADDLPGVTLQSVLRPAPGGLGAADLAIDATMKPVEASFGLDNRGSRYIGPLELYGNINFNDRLGLGEQFGFGYSTTPKDFQEEKAYTVNYIQPITPQLGVSFNAYYTTGKPGFSLQTLNVVPDAIVFGPRVSYSFERTRHENISIDAGFTVHEESADVQGQPFYIDHYRTVDLRGNYSQAGFLDGVSTVTADISKGLEILGASYPGEPNLSRADGRADFTKLTVDARRLQTLPWNLSVLVAGYGQLSGDPLLEGEEFGLGGPQIVRGYDPQDVVGDHGIAGTLELRFDHRVALNFIRSTQYYIFYDTGEVWKIHGPSNHGLVETSFGGGFRLVLENDLSANVEIAQPIGLAPSADSGKHPTMVYFTLIQRF
jgi:hemolysin activation/secretion protein